MLAVQSFRSVAEAIDLANNTFFGLAGSVWTENLALAQEVAVSIKAGAIWINAHNVFDAAAGFGGYRESGFGRDGGKEGLYEYVKPAWQGRPRPSLKFPTNEVKWSSRVPGAPASPDAPHSTDINAGAKLATGVVIDRTYKVYIAGQQKRPDGCYSYPVLSPDGKLVGEAADGNRKDIRDAVEAAHAAAGGWGKRAAHNRAQICYYIAENLMARFDEFVGRIRAQTGKLVFVLFVCLLRAQLALISVVSFKSHHCFMAQRDFFFFVLFALLCFFVFVLILFHSPINFYFFRCH